MEEEAEEEDGKGQSEVTEDTKAEDEVGEDASTQKTEEGGGAVAEERQVEEEREKEEDRVRLSKEDPHHRAHPAVSDSVYMMSVKC